MNKIILVLTALLLSTPAWATVPSATPLYTQYSCNSSTTQWPYTFQISATSDIQVYVNDNAGTITQVATSNYSVDTSNVWVTYPLIGSACPTGSTITLQPSTPQTQLLNLGNRSPFVGSAVMGALDKLTLISQQLQAQLNRAVLAPAGTTAFTFPSSVPNYLLGWDPAGSGNIVNFVPNTGSYLAKASTAAAQAATDDTTYMTPAKVKTEVQFSGAVTIPYANLTGVANSGANSNITSLTSLSTPLSVAQGGTGSTAAINTAGGVVVPTGAVNAASGAVVLNASSKIPALDGSLLTGLTGTQITSLFGTDQTGKTATTVYTAATDGWFQLCVGNLAGFIFSDSSNPPTTAVGGVTGTTGGTYCASALIHKGMNYKYTVSSGSATSAIFTPVGS